MKHRGFTLIELMIVIAIIAIVAAIAIPSLLRARLNANEGSAIQSMRTISSAELVYHTQRMRTDATSGVGQYGDLPDLGSDLPPFIDSNLAAGKKSGYVFAVVPVDDLDNPQYLANAEPVLYERTGVRSFFVDDSGIIRFTKDGNPADGTSTPLN